MRSLFLLAIALCAGCAAPRISENTLELARSTTSGGGFHIEFDAEGRLIEAGAEVPRGSVPPACLAAVDAEFPGGFVTGAGRMLVGDDHLWMVAKRIAGRDLEVLVRDDGTVVGGEEELARSDWPSHVVTAATDAVPGSRIERVERVWGRESIGREAFHVKLQHQGDSIRVGVAEDGSVTRVVRRLPAQVRVPR